MKKKNGFTLIELLAVIIILGILMIIAIPSVTRYISDSRKSAYVDTAKEIIGSARNLVNSGELEMYATDTTYYIPTSCIKTENASKSPYGEFTEAYIGVIYDGKGYNYYWISVDDAGQGVSKITPLDKLDVDSIESDLKREDIKNTVETTGIGNRSEIKILNCSNNNWDRQYHLDDTSGNVTESGLPNDPLAAVKILAIAQAAGQLNRIGETNNYIFKGGSDNPPSNYVKFNCTNPSDTSTCENWRIIGIYDNQLKIIRVKDNGRLSTLTELEAVIFSSERPNLGYAYSTVKDLLNDETTGYYSTLTNNAKEMIDDNGNWDVGATHSDSTAYSAYTEATTSGTKLGTVTHITPWVGRVGLISSYEFLYAAGIDDCLETTGNLYSSTCGKSNVNWLRPISTIWTLSPGRGTSDNSITVSSGHLFRATVSSNTCGAIPTVFLKSSVKVASGDGTSGNPYILNLE